jgi:amino-acid N-acetyltransferase
MESVIRRARSADAAHIQRLIKVYADRDLMLPRSLSEIYESLRDFFVIADDTGLIGCAACHVTWEDLAEIKCMAVREDRQRQGWGDKLMQACIEDAARVGVKRVFVLTYAPEFFERRGFARIEKSELPHKIWSECVRCVNFPNCGEVALIRDLEGPGTIAIPQSASGPQAAP